MKKVFCLIIGLLLMISSCYAEGDITFQGIPWMTDEYTTLQMLRDVGYIVSEKEPSFTEDKTVYLVQTENELVIPDTIRDYKEVSSALDLSGKVRGKVAGYPVRNLILSYAYDGKFKLIAVKVELVKPEYIDIKNKIMKVYGEGEEKGTEEGVEIVIWKGNDNSALLLYTDTAGADFQLVYGRLDAEEILANCLVSDPDDVSGL